MLHSNQIYVYSFYYFSDIIERSSEKQETLPKKNQFFSGFGSLKRNKKAKTPETKEANAELDQSNGSAEPDLVQTDSEKTADQVGEPIEALFMEETKPQEVEAKVEGLHETLNEIEKLVEDLEQVAYENHSENESNELKAISKPDWGRAEAELRK